MQPRKRTRKVTVGENEDNTGQLLDDAMLAAYSAKVTKDEADKAYSEAKALIEKHMKTLGKSEHKMPPLQGRPGLKAKFVIKTTTTISAEKLFKLMGKTAEFFASVKVTAAVAKKHNTETQLESISTSSTGTPSLDYRTTS